VHTTPFCETCRSIAEIPPKERPATRDAAKTTLAAMRPRATACDRAVFDLILTNIDWQRGYARDFRSPDLRPSEDLWLSSIAAICGFCVRQVRRAIAKLEAARLVIVKRSTRSDGSKAPSLFTTPLATFLSRSNDAKVVGGCDMDDRRGRVGNGTSIERTRVASRVYPGAIVYPPEFEAVWRAYPDAGRNGKPVAFERWQRMAPDHRDKLPECIGLYHKRLARQRTPTFIPRPRDLSGFLNPNPNKEGASYLDYLEQVGTGPMDGSSYIDTAVSDLLRR
jgi:hypothetical protein